MSIGNFRESLSQQLLVGIILVGRLGVPTDAGHGSHAEEDRRVNLERGLLLAKNPHKEFTRLAETRLAQNTLNK